MYDLSFVRKRKRRKLVAIGSLISAFGITSMAMISYLGQSVGTITVSLKNSLVQLALSQKLDFAEETSYIKYEGIKSFEENTYRFLPADSILDNENTPFTYGEVGELASGRYSFFKITYYVKNVGRISANYVMDVNIGGTSAASDGSGRTLDDTVRIMIYDNIPEDNTHNKRIYAKASYTNNLDRDGQLTDREFVSVPASQEDDDHPLAETFYSSTIVARYTVDTFDPHEVRRYTIVMWLEGEDPQARGGFAPEGASIEFGVTISGNESER
ncbi:MAG: hypothetical protein GX807_03430 [Erysipelotrichia bacterium]|nr:hypothetical protein [Erysipelotrichia bacterium]